VSGPAPEPEPAAAPAPTPVRPSPWQQATVLAVRDETPRARTYRLALPHPVPHLAGQHYVVRLTAPDGYTASRSYSVASPPDDSGEIELTVELLADGEVSGYLHEVVEPGDELEVRGPIGGWFVWDADAPALLVGGGSGLVPLMAMLRLARRTGREDRVRLVVSVRGPDDLYYAAELPGPEVAVVYTREAPPGADRPAGRLAAADVAAALGSAPAPDLTAYVCGSAGFATHAARLLVDAGLPADHIRVERFGPTG
jgi:ferredoxin-NADP reductase